MAVYQSNQVVDLITVSDQLHSSDNLKKVGGRAELVQFFSRYVNESYLNSCAQRIRANAALRDLGEVAAELLNECQTAKPEENTIYTMVDSVQGKLSDVISKGKAEDVGEAKTDIPAVANRLVQPLDAKGSGVLSGFTEVDNVLRGFRDGQLILLAARSRVGKTSMACDLVRNVAAQGYTVVFYSLEMTRSEIWERMVCAEAGVSLHDLKARQATANEAQAIAAASDKLSQFNIIVKDAPNITPMGMRGFARKVQHQKKLGMVVVDYLQCIQTGKDKQTRYEVVSEVSRQLKVLARTLNVPVIALAQLNRQAEEESPRLAQLRESGSLEQDADVVLLLNRPNVFDSSKDPTLATLDIAKHRNGPCQLINLAFDSATVSFSDRRPKVEDFAQIAAGGADSPVAPPRPKRQWWGSRDYD